MVHIDLHNSPPQVEDNGVELLDADSVLEPLVELIVSGGTEDFSV